MAVWSLGGCGSGGFEGESVAQIAHVSFTNAANAASFRIVGIVALHGRPVSINVEVGRSGEVGSLTADGARTSFEYANGSEFVRLTARTGAEFLGVVVPRAFKIGWIRLHRPISTLPRFRRLLTDLAKASTGTLTKVGVVHVYGQRAVRLAQPGAGYIDVALRGEPLPVDVVYRARLESLRFEQWNQPIRLRPPTHWISLAEARARPPVHTIVPREGTVLSSVVRDGELRFRAAGVHVEFDYPADFVPLRLDSTRRAGSNRGEDIAVGLGSDLALIVTQFSRIRVPVTTQNVGVLAPAFDRAMSAIAGHSVGVRAGSIDGHVLLSFDAFTLADAYGTRTLKAFNIFFGDRYAELQCQFTAPERTLGLNACRKMIATLRVT